LASKMLFKLLVVLQCISLVPALPLLCYIFKSAPSQFRVALRGTNGVTVSWKTNGCFGSNDVDNPKVAYSTNSNLAGSVTSPVGDTTNYNTAAFFHNVALLNLQSGTTYYYQILASDYTTQSSIYSFTTPPAAGNSNSVNVAFVGDLGVDSILTDGGAARTIAALKQAASTTNVFVHNGDISYADDYNLLLLPKSYDQLWNEFQDGLTSLTANNFYMTGPGNHEVTCFQLGDSFCQGSPLRNFSAYLNRLRMPGDESGGYKNLWYSFNYGPVHIAVINTETDFVGAPSGPGTTLNGGNFQGTTGQLNWLQADLAAANGNRANVPWVVVTGHRPFFSSVPAFPAVPGNCSTCAAAFYQTLVNNKVDLYVGAHIHWYERLYPIDANGNPVSTSYTSGTGSLIHITNGAGGAAEGKASVQSTIPASAEIVTGYGFVQFQAQSSTTAQVNFFSSDTNTVQDSFTITRTP
jgi:hypothetical protein